MNLGHSTGLHERRQERQLLVALAQSLRGGLRNTLDPRWIRPEELSGPRPGEPAGPVRLSMLKGAYSGETCCPRSWLGASSSYAPHLPT